MSTQYLSKFDDAGRRLTTVVSGIHFETEAEKQAYLDDGYIEHSEDDWQHYIGNYGAGENGTGYIHDHETGNPVSAPPYVPTAEEIAEAEREAAHAEITMETVEEALCAMDESIEEIKDALCEIDAKLEGGN